MEREIEANGIVNVTVHPYGASNANATLELTVPDINSGEATFGKNEKYGNKYYTVAAQLMTADSLLENERPKLIKIDVEGFECRVIEGLTETLKKHHPIVITEIIKEHLIACGSSLAELTKLLIDHGYTGRRLNLDKNKKYSLQPMMADENNYDAVWLPA
jgi:FkbM family methyltransferase